MKYGIKIAALAMAPVAFGGTLALVAGTSSSASASTTHHVQQRMPAGFHYRSVWYQIDDCGKHNAGQKKVMIWKGNGDMQSALFCPDGTVWPS
ncbi:MAG TPA: hypothetical protein VNS88_14080 [Nitrospiraceae bacterium]|nr:hypothetical protein [Nitrospiraceae bacterium]